LNSRRHNGFTKRFPPILLLLHLCSDRCRISSLMISLCRRVKWRRPWLACWKALSREPALCLQQNEPGIGAKGDRFHERWPNRASEAKRHYPSSEILDPRRKMICLGRIQPQDSPSSMNENRLRQVSLKSAPHKGSRPASGTLQVYQIFQPLRSNILCQPVKWWLLRWLFVRNLLG